jgi:hypothetical protein
MSIFCFEFIETVSSRYMNIYIFFASVFYSFVYSASSQVPRRSEHSGAKWNVASKKVPAYRLRRVDGIPNGACLSDVKVRSPTLAAWKATIMLAADPSIVKFPAMVAEKDTCNQS